MKETHKVVIIGGGFGGIHAAKALKNAPVEVNLIDKRNFHLFQPLLYQVATGGLSAGNITAPIRSIFSKQNNVHVTLGNVTDIDPDKKCVYVNDECLDYDSLIVAAGSENSYFGNDNWEKYAPGLKTLEDAFDIRRRIWNAFEQAELEKDPKIIEEWLTFVVIGGGPTGVEMAGAIAEIANKTLKDDFNNINPKNARVILVEGGKNILGNYTEKLSKKAEQHLNDLGVMVLKGTYVTDMNANSITTKQGNKTDKIESQTILWAAGIKANSLGNIIAERTGAETDRMGRVLVNKDCTIQNYEDIFVIGDLAHHKDKNDSPLPGVAQVAIQQGAYCSNVITKRIQGQPVKDFSYLDMGSMATIGRSKAVANIFKLKLSGYFAWLIWIFVHLMGLVQHSNRLIVFLQWTWSYWTFDKSARIITYPCRRAENDDKHCMRLAQAMLCRKTPEENSNEKNMYVN